MQKKDVNENKRMDAGKSSMEKRPMENKRPKMQKLLLQGKSVPKVDFKTADEIEEKNETPLGEKIFRAGSYWWLVF